MARAAGVSVATVSKAINGHYGVSPATSRRVLDVVEELGYESSLVASSLRRRRTNVIGILVPEFEPFATEILKGISAASIGTGYELMAYSGNMARDQIGWERRSLSRLSGTLIDGAIVVAPSATMTTATIPVVAIDPQTGPDSPTSITADNLGGASAATEYLLSLGHRRIAHVRGRQDLESARLRELGYRQALEAAGLEPDPDLTAVGGYRAAETTDAAHALLELPTPPTAVFAANDQSAIRVIEVAQSLGLRVPEDLSVVGFDNIPEAANCVPPLTTIAQPMRELGTESVRLLLELLAGHEVPHVLQLPTRLVVRGSTAPLTP